MQIVCGWILDFVWVWCLVRAGAVHTGWVMRQMRGRVKGTILQRSVSRVLISLS